jgi:hypothetical protein
MKNKPYYREVKHKREGKRRKLRRVNMVDVLPIQE